MDAIKTNKTRRQRGYNFERDLVQRINACNGWKALRLGSPSVSLPDIIAVNNSASILLAIEAKSTSTNIIRVPLDQIVRCFKILDTFVLYKHRYAILALKFMSKRWKKAYTYEHRGIREYYRVCYADANISNIINNSNSNSNGNGNGNSNKDASIVCRYDGSISINNDDKNDNYLQLTLQDFTMPFECR